MKHILQVICFFIPSFICAQLSDDAWVSEQLSGIAWQETYVGVLADYHPVTLMLASDHQMIAGYLIHGGDQQKHRVLGDWNASGLFQLQERDAYDRLSGYLTGSVSQDKLQMKWLSPDQSRLFEVKAFPEKLIKIKNFKAVSECIQLSADPLIYFNIHKMENGMVSGLCYREGNVCRLDGQCLDGTCSIWDASMVDEQGKVKPIQMRQKDPSFYKAMLDGKEYKGMISFSTPLVSKLYDNSAGFLDCIYPRFSGSGINHWISGKVDSIWTMGLSHLQADPADVTNDRLNYRVSGWVEVIDEGDGYVSGLMTFIYPDKTEREPFLWLKKEDVIIDQHELLNAPADLEKAMKQARSPNYSEVDRAYADWLDREGFRYMIPMRDGLVLTTGFSMIYGDGFGHLPLAESKSLIKRKYWKYFDW